MKRQQGAALIIVLSLLTVSLMVGLSSMQSSQIDERLAGNYKAATEAQMAAEIAASEGYEDKMSAVSSADDVEDGIPWVALQDSPLSEYLDGRYVLLDKSAAKHVESSYLGGWGDGWEDQGDFFVLGQGVVNQGGSDVRREVLLTVIKDSSGLDSVFNCLGYQCVENRVNADGALDGADHPVSGQPFNCQGASCRYSDDEDLDSVAEFSGFEPGDPGYDARRDAWEKIIDNLPSPVKTYDGSKGGGRGGGNDKIGDHGSREDPVVIEVTGEVRINGNSDTAGIIIVRDGGSITKANGTAHHEGLIIVEEGGTFDMTSGTFNLYGAVMKLKPEDEHGHNGAYDLIAGGNARISYSSEAIENLQKLVDIESFLSSVSSPEKINSWVEL
ncbi:MAG: pilus assembly PilX family protein [Pseudomonadota bacterium]